MSTIIKNNNLELGLKKFKTETARSGILSKAKEKAEYKKPGVRRREEKKINTINSRRNNRKNNY